jgi:hypothetical protein
METNKYTIDRTVLGLLGASLLALALTMCSCSEPIQEIQELNCDLPSYAKGWPSLGYEGEVLPGEHLPSWKVYQETRRIFMGWEVIAETESGYTLECATSPGKINNICKDFVDGIPFYYWCDPIDDTHSINEYGYGTFWVEFVANEEGEIFPKYEFFGW